MYDLLERKAKEDLSVEEAGTIVTAFVLLDNDPEPTPTSDTIHSTESAQMLDTSATWADDLRSRGGIGFTPRRET
jgi:hypothetical protein